MSKPSVVGPKPAYSSLFLTKKSPLPESVGVPASPCPEKPVKEAAGVHHRPDLYGADLPRTIPVTELFQMVQQFQSLPPRSKVLRDQFFTSYQHVGGRRYIYSLLQPFLETGRVHPKKGEVNEQALVVAKKVADEKKRLFEISSRLPSTAMTLDILRTRGELKNAEDVSVSYLNKIIQKSHFMRDLADSNHVRVGCPGVRFCHFADTTGSSILKLRNDGRVEIGPAIDSRYLKNHKYEYLGRRSVYYITFVDQYSGYIHGDVVTICNSMESARIARDFWLKWGKPEWVNVDRGPEFKGVFKLFCEQNQVGFQPRGLRNKRAGGKVETVNLRIQQQFELELLGVRGLGTIMPLEEVREAFRGWQAQWNSRPCPRDSVKS